MVFHFQQICQGLLSILVCWRHILRHKIGMATVQMHLRYYKQFFIQTLVPVVKSDSGRTIVSLLWPNYFAGGCKILWHIVKILPSHFMVTCYPYKEVHVTAKCDGKILTTCHPFCTPSKIVRPWQCMRCIILLFTCPISLLTPSFISPAIPSSLMIFVALRSCLCLHIVQDLFLHPHQHWIYPTHCHPYLTFLSSLVVNNWLPPYKVLVKTYPQSSG